MASRATKRKKMSKTMYVYKHGDATDSFFIADDNLEGFGDEEGNTIGIYELKEEKKLVVTRELK